MNAALWQSKARGEGYAAGRRGLSASENPYPLGTLAAAEWLAGFAATRVRRPHLIVISGGRRD